MSTQKLNRFKSTKASYCTCLPKYSLNPYLGQCAHACIYCYSRKFPNFTGPIKPRLTLPDTIDKIARNTHPKLPVMISDCTDPYQPLEKKYKITRKCVATLTKYNFPLLILTKSDLVTRDIDLLNETTVVALTITTLDEDVAKFIEPNAPSPLKRINCLEKISNHNIPIAARIDPIIPSINDDERDFEQLVSILADLGVTHITISTLKPVKGFFKNLRQLDPSLYIKLKNIYDEGVSILGYQYLPARVRYRIVQKFRSIVLKYKLNFSSCREGFPQLNTSICDGSEKCRKQTKLMGFLQ